MNKSLPQLVVRAAARLSKEGPAAAGQLTIPAIASVGAVLTLAFLGVVLVRTLAFLGDESGRAALIQLFGSTEYYFVLLDTCRFALISMVTAMVFGVPIAWLTERSQLPGRDLIRLFMTLGILIPGYFTAMGWLFLAHPRIGMLSGWMRDTFGFSISATSLTGMAIVQGLVLAPLSFVVAAPSLAAIDPTLEESAEVHGLRMWSRLIYVTLPIIAPALMASALLTFMVSLAVFDIPAVLGLSNKIVLYSTYIYNLLNPNAGVPLYELAAASSIPMLLLAMVLSGLYYRLLRRSHRYQVVSGKAYRLKQAELRPLACVASWIFVGLYLFLADALPLLTIAWTSLLPFFRRVSLDAVPLLSLNNYAGLLTPAFWETVVNTVTLAIVAPTLTLLLSLTISWMITRRRGLVGRFFEVVSFLPLAVPSVIFAVGGIAIALALGSHFPIYGTIWLIVLIEAVVYISMATRIINGAMLQIHKELDEAGAAFGLSVVTRFTRIVVPLLMPAILYCWVFLALLASRELTVPALLVSRDNVTISVYTWGLLNGGSYGRAAALTMLVIMSFAGIGLATVVVKSFIARSRAVPAPAKDVVGKPAGVHV